MDRRHDVLNWKEPEPIFTRKGVINRADRRHVEQEIERIKRKLAPLEINFLECVLNEQDEAGYLRRFQQYLHMHEELCDWFTDHGHLRYTFINREFPLQKYGPIEKECDGFSLMEKIRKRVTNV